MVIELSLAFIGLVLSMFFSYSELALISANKLQINVWEKQKIRFSNFAQSIVGTILETKFRGMYPSD